MTDLDKLIAKVEAGVVDITAPAHLAFGGKEYHPPSGIALYAANAYRGSLDAALRLHEALLPGAHWNLAEDDDYGFCAKVFFGGWHHEHSSVAARAWLLAILRAIKAERPHPQPDMRALGMEG